MALATSPIASASELQGTVVNGTENLPEATDGVVLLSVSADGMRQTAGSKADHHPFSKEAGAESGTLQRFTCFDLLTFAG